MTYKQCICCKLSLPISIMSPIQIKHKGKIVTVGICDNCKAKKIAEAKKEIK